MGRSRLLAGLVTSLVATAAFAVVPPEETPLRRHEFRHPDLDFRNIYRPLADLPPEVSARLGSDLSRLGVAPGNAYYDPLTGRWGTLVVTQPLLPGPGVGNSLHWSDLGLSAPPGAGELGDAAAEAFTRYLASHAAELRIDPAELTTPRVKVHGERVIQIHIGRQIDGIPVRGAFVAATINSGNLVLLGEREWGEVALDTRPGIASAAAEASLRAHLEGLVPSGFRKEPQLAIVPMSSPGTSLRAPDAGLEHRLIWVLAPEFAGDPVGRWEALVDAGSGELLSFQDTTHYASRRLEGAIYPVSNDGVPPDGVLQEMYPLPFADIALDGEPVGFTSTGGNVPPGAGTGTISTALSGRYLTMNDNCGVVDESAASGDLDLEGVDGTDCAVPAGHSPGDTNSTRSGYYEINRIMEQARGYWPDNGWLQQTLTANMNIDATCNAGWNGSVNFFKSGGGCSNTGELAGVFDHEWGHGMDNNDATGSVSNPGEGIADIFAANRLNTSCMGRNFRPGNPCNGYGDACTECTGVRDIDWAKRVSGQPHDVAWIDVNCGSGSSTPCGGSTHCEGAVYSEAVWDLVHRDLMGFEGSPFDLDLNTALELGTRLSYYGSSNVGNWFQCVTDGTGGCNADGGYLNYLAVDDDNGDLTDGTPHMSAIFAAFDRHQIACLTPTVQDSGCAGAPATAPSNVVATPLNEGAHVAWDAVTGATEYWVYRTEGVHGCDFGKSLVGKTTSTELVEFGLKNGFEVLYSVVAVGASDACTSPMSACAPVSPVEGPGLGFDPSPPEWTGQTGDGDVFFDNCETGTLTFTVSNTGTGALTDVRIVEASIPSHPEVEILTDLPATIAANLPEGESAVAELEVLGGGFAFNDTLTLEVTVTSDELDPLALPHTYSLTALESDLQAEPTLTFSFEEGEDGWQLMSGIFDRTDAPPGGANGTAFYRASSTGLNLQCDRIRSPLIELTETSTLELYNQFDIEDFSGGFWWDRANLGVFDPLTGERTIVSPDGGRLYNASGSNPAPAPCASHVPPEAAGWAGPGPNWEASTWTAAALGSPDLAGQLIQLDVAYGTDPAALGTIGFWFDEVTLTDVNVQVPDAQSDECGGGGPVLSFDPASLDFGDVEVGTTSPPQAATLANTGDADATGVTFSGLPDAGFEVASSDCGDTLPAGGSCAVSVTFTPAAPGPATATLHVDSTEGATADLSLAGNGVGGPVADIACDSLDFELPQGGSGSSTCTIGNPGDADLTWSLHEAEGDALTSGVPYAYGLVATPEFRAPVGYDRASGRRSDPKGAPADPVVLPAPQPGVIDELEEGFDDIMQLPGAGWALINNSEPPGPTSWFQGNETIFPAGEGEPDSYIAANYESTDGVGTISNWLITPEVTIANGTQLTFWTRKPELFEEFADRMEVRMSVAGDSTDVGDTAESVGDFTEVLVTINPDLIPGEYPQEWTQFTLTVSGVPAPTSGRFAFRYWVTDSGPDGTNGDYIGIDTVSIAQTGGCADPTDIPWLAEDPTSGTTPAGGSSSVDVSVDSTGLEVGEYSARLCFVTNDPEAPLFEFPVNLTVTPVGGPIADITPESFSFEVPEGGSDSDTLNVGNIGGADLTWSIHEAVPIVAPEGAPYRYGLAETPEFNAPMGYDRASSARLKRPASVPADRVVLPAPQPAAIGDFTEGFDDITTLPGAGWALINNSEPLGPSSWFQGNPTIFPAHDGAPDAYIAANFESTAAAGDISNWLITPEVTIVNGTTITFWTRKAELFEEFADRMEVRMSVAGASTDVGDTAESVGDFTEVLLTINPDLIPGEYPQEWTQFTLTVRERSREPVTGRFAFRYWVTDSGPEGTNGDYIGIDTVSVKQPGEPGGCDDPVDVPWLAADPTSGITPPGDSVPVTVSVDATDLDPGEYAALLCVATDDPNAPLVKIPVSLTVTTDDGGLDVLLAAAFGGACNATDPQGKIMATGFFDSVDTLDLVGATPTVDELLAYDAVMVWTNQTPADTPQLSDNLADYVDAGGGVVVTVFANSTTTSGRFLTGRWVDDGYEVIVGQSGNRTGLATLGTVHQPDHPLMEGVSTFNGGESSFRPDAGELTPGSASIADWSDGIPLIAVHGTLPNRADLGFYPPSSDCNADFWDSSTDGARIMANALAYVAGAGNVVGSRQ